MASADSHDRDPSASTIMFAFFAAALLIMTGVIVLVYVLFDQVRKTDIILDIQPATWRILLLGAGCGLVAAGLNLFAGKFWAQATGLVMATVAMMSALLHLNEDPVFAICLIILNLGIIYALTIRWADVKRITDG